MDKWYTINKAASGVAEIAIFGDIGYGYSAADFNRDLTALGKVDAIDLRISTHGGDVFAGNAIYSMLKRTKAKIRVTVDGLAASMGSVIAMAGDERIMPENAMLMIHNPIGGVEGGVDEIKSFAEMLKNLEDGIVKAYVDATNLSEQIVRGLMDKETWLTAARAVELGFATKIEKPVKVTASAFQLGRFRNVPKDFGTQLPTTEETHDMADVKETIKRVCALAGKADLADKFITDNKTVDDVLTALDALKKQEDAATVSAAAEARAKEAATAAAAGKAVDEKAVKAALLAEQNEIKALCRLAGLPDKADEYISAGKSPSETIKALDEAKKAKVEGSGKRAVAGKEVTAHHNPRAESDNVKELDTTKVWDKFNRRKTA